MPANTYTNQVLEESALDQNTPTLSTPQAASNSASVASAVTVAPTTIGVPLACVKAAWNAAVQGNLPGLNYEPWVAAVDTSSLLMGVDDVNTDLTASYGAPEALIDPAKYGAWLTLSGILAVPEVVLLLRSVRPSVIPSKVAESLINGYAYISEGGARTLLSDAESLTSAYGLCLDPVPYPDAKSLSSKALGEAIKALDSCAPRKNLVPGVPQTTTDTTSTVEEKSVAATRYTGSNMIARRPTGSFFIVELLNSAMVPQSVPMPGGYSVNSLILNMSPESMSVNSTKIVNRYQTLTRWVEDHWGDELDQVSFNGKTFSFLSFDDDAGLVAAGRENTDPYKELSHLASIYLSNGLIYQEKTLPLGMERRLAWLTQNPNDVVALDYHPRAGMVKERLYIRLRHDFVEFTGFFETFEVVEDSASPFNLQYSVTFRSELTRWY